jgi:flagellar assembly protein FliH
VTPSYRRIPSVKLDGRRYPIVADSGPGADGSYAEAAGPLSPEDEAADKMQKAYEAGYQAGHAASAKELEVEMAGKARDLTSMIDDVVSQRSRLVSESEEAVVRLACDIAKRIVEKVADVDKETIVRVAKASVARLADSQKVTIRVSPSDLEVLEKHRAEWLQATRSGSSVEIQEDERIRRGGCLIEGSSGYIEAEIDRQIGVFERALVEAVG